LKRKTLRVTTVTGNPLLPGERDETMTAGKKGWLDDVPEHQGWQRLFTQTW